jgi:hypothetical protein
MRTIRPGGGWGRSKDGGITNKLVALFAITLLALLEIVAVTPSFTQTPTTGESSTFYHLVPGVYVNPWPRFTVTYPKDWVETYAITLEVFRAVPRGNTGDVFAVALSGPGTLDKIVGGVAEYFRIGRTLDVTVVTDKPTQLSNGVPAREGEIRGTADGLPFNFACLAVKHGDDVILVSVQSQSGKIGDHLKAILYSLRYEPQKDDPVKVPPDVQEFLDSLSGAWVSHDLAKLMALWSDRYLNSGIRKGEMERNWRQGLGLITTFEYGITEFVPAGETAYLAGFAVRNGAKYPLRPTSIIKENGQWKWYGNQRDVAR